MLGYRELAAVVSAVGLMAFQSSSTLETVDPRELRETEHAFRSTFKGVDVDGQSLVWSSDALEASAAPAFVMRIVPMGSALSSAESAWAVSATVTMRDNTGARMESKLYGIIDWSKHELQLHGTCASGAKSGSSVTATGTFTHFDVAGTVDVLPLTASR